MNGFHNLTARVTRSLKCVYGEDPAVFVYAGLIAIIVLSPRPFNTGGPVDGLFE
jgi:hypothetical protein